jgi:beta-glucosidase
MMKKLHIIGVGVGVVLLAAILFIIVKVTGTTNNSNKDETIQNDSTNKDGEDIISETPVLTEGGVMVYLSSTEEAQNQNWYKKPYQLSNTLTQQDNLNITEVDNSAITTINIDTKKTYDPFYGIGTSLDESTVYNLLQLTDEARKEFIYKLVDPVNGAGMSLFRLTIGTADFTGQEFYTYYDGRTLEGEPNWYPEEGEAGFSIQKDIDVGIIEIVQLVIEAAKEYGIYDEVRFISSPWSPPGWMKEDTSSSLSYANNELLLKGGKLNSNYIDELAMYYTRYVEEYAKLGIQISGLTLQNEPLLEIDYPSCYMTGTQEAQLTIALKETLNNSQILKDLGATIPKLWAFDHNPADLLSYMSEFFSVEGALDALDGVAVHDYYGALSEMQRLKEIYFAGTDKTVHLTERSVWGTEGANRIIDYYRNGAISYNSWVTMLDSNISPHQWVGTPSVTMFVREAGSDSNYWACPEFYIAGNFGRFIRPGYVRIESDPGSLDTVTNIVYANKEDGTMVAVVVNQTKSNQNLKFVVNNKQILATIPAGNVGTYIWKEDAALIAEPIINGGAEIEVEVDTSTRQADKAKVITLDGNQIALKETDAFETKGSLASRLEKGNYLDYLIDVKKAGTYQITYSVKCDVDGAGVAFGLLTVSGKQENPAKIGENKQNISIPNLYGAQKIRYAVYLEEGMQTLRFKAQSIGYTISAITVERPNITVIPATGTTMKAISFYDGQNSHAIENDSNIGYTNSGSTLDYKVAVDESGIYKLQLKYAATATPNMLIQGIKSDGTALDLGTVMAPSTGEWSTYKLSEPIDVNLEAGEFTLRLVVQGDGINLSEILISK